jgi:hypothetical protein
MPIGLSHDYFDWSKRTDTRWDFEIAVPTSAEKEAPTSTAAQYFA